MCLAVPGEVLAFVDPTDELRFARVSFGGVIKQVSLVYLPEAQLGDFVLVHAGFAIAQIDEAHAAEVLETLADLARPHDEA